MLRTGVKIDGGRGLLDLGLRHLRGDGTLPDQVVEAAFLVGPLSLVVVGKGRTDSLVGFLCSFRLCLVLAWMTVFCTIFFRDLLLARIQGQG